MGTSSQRLPVSLLQLLYHLHSHSLPSHCHGLKHSTLFQVFVVRANRMQKPSLNCTEATGGRRGSLLFPELLEMEKSMQGSCDLSGGSQLRPDLPGMEWADRSVSLRSIGWAGRSKEESWIPARPQTPFQQTGRRAVCVEQGEACGNLSNQPALFPDTHVHSARGLSLNAVLALGQAAPRSLWNSLLRCAG